VAHILVVTCVYPPEVVVSSKTSAAIAAGLALRGHDVTVFAPYPTRAGAEGVGRRAWFREERHPGGPRVIWCPTIPSRGATMRSRFVEYLTFGMSGSLAAVRVEGASVLYANTWPLVGVGFAALTAKLMRIPLVLSVQDIYPESLVAQGRLREAGLLFRALRGLDGVMARSARAVVVIAESFRRQYVRGRRVDPARVHVVPNWVESDSITPDSAGRAGIRERHGIPQGAFVVGYGGNVGPASGLEQVLGAFSELRTLTDAFLLVAGEGSRLAECRRQAETLGLDRVLFHTPWLQEETSDVLAAADLLLLPTQGDQALVSMPSKLISYMLASRPVLAVAPESSDLAEAIREAGCGWVVPSADARSLARKIRDLRETWDDEIRAKGRAGRAYALANFTEAACLPRVLDLIEAECARRREG
jgi:colanic acid biosynthesis glycosyl transferase WcaI